jgi:WD40 repeat protein
MLPQGVERAVLHGHTGEVRALVVSLDGQLLVSGGQDGTIRLWRLPQGQEHAVLHGHTGAVRALAVSPNGQLLASGSADRTIRLWTLPGGQAQAVWQGHQRGVRALAMGPTCQLLAAGCGDGTIRLWELWDMSPMLQVPLGHMGRTEYERVRLGTVEASLSSEQQVVARYVAAMLRYRLGEDRP